MEVPPALQRQLDRWYKLKDHPVQLELIRAVDDGIRFPLVPAGRRSGKTERAKRFLVKRASSVKGIYFAAAPTVGQAKKIFWEDLKALSLSATHEKKPSESELKIFLPGGSEIHVIGLDSPQRIEGIPWKGGIIDEIADLADGAWELHIFPALNTVNPLDPDYRAWCWLIGVPDGLNHYYRLCQKAETGADKNSKVFHWKSSEILPPDVIQAAKENMSAEQYNQEFNASFETATGRIYNGYSPENYTAELIQPHEQLLWFHDFNFTPMSSGIGVIRDGALYILDEIILRSAIARQSAQEFIDRYESHQNKHVIIYGDPAGRAGEKHGHASDYTEMEALLKSNNWKFTRKVKLAAPAIRDRQNAVRAKICNANGHRSLFVNPIKCPYSHEGLSTVQFKEGSTFLEQESDYQHITTAIGYCVELEWPVKVDKEQVKSVNAAIKNHW